MTGELPKVGATVDGKYRIEHTLGKGGMGVVLAARHVHLGHLVAIKFPVSSRVLSDSAVERLLREARAVMRLQSDHVARVYDIGVHEGERPYLVMEYLNGSDLARVLGAGPLTVATAVDYALDACAALAEAHAKGIVHRDLKPSNLFLSQRSDGTTALKVIDFGLAKDLRGEDADALTVSGAILGSPWFMAPEQMRGLVVDERADIWALGATFYALLTGLRPFAGKNMLDVYDRILAGPPSFAEKSAAVGAALEAVVHRCLKVPPAERYASVADFADALVTATAFPTTKAERVRRIATGASFLDPATERGRGDREHGTTTPPESGTAPPRDPSWNDGRWRHSDTPRPVTARSGPTKRNLTPVRGLALAALGLAISLALGLARYHRFISGPEIRLGSASVWTKPSALGLTTAASPVDDGRVLIASARTSAQPAPSAKSGLRAQRAVPLREVNSPASAKPRLPILVARDPLAEPD